MLRAGPCVPRLTPLYRLLQPLAGCARVVQCAEAVPTLLRAFFSAVTQVSPLPGASVPAAEGLLELGPTGPQLPQWPRGQSITADRAAHTSPSLAPVPPRTGAERSPQGSSQPGLEQRCSLGVGRSLSLSLSPSLLTGPWPASWHCCSWNEATRFTRSQGTKPVCTGGSLLAGFAPPAAPWPSPGRVHADPALSAPHGSGSPAATDPSPASALSRPLYAPFPAHPSPSSTEPSRTCVPLAEGPVYAGSSPLQPSLFPGGARGSWRGRDYLYLHLVLGGFPPPPSSPRDGPRGWGLCGASTAHGSSRAGC